jgi:two-component system response regulator GlrR
MEETRIFILDLNPTSKLGYALREILEHNVTLSIYLREETVGSSGFDAFFPEFSRIILHFAPDIIFLALPPNYLKQTKKLIQSLEGKPLIAVFEGFKSEETFELLKLGVSDFITPPLKAVDVLPRIWRLLEQRRSAERLIRSLKEKVGLKQLVGKSPSFLGEIEKIPMVAKCDASVLILGETGTGKELFARAIHYLSSRASKPFIPTSCGAIPLELVENELFGHIQGAFTGASSAQPGLIHEAHGGTLFLDEIDCLPLLSQVKFLRFLQEKEYKQLGSAKVHHADVRVVAATNIDLEKAVKEGKFRQDLYYRLNIIPLLLPPLRERKEDIPVLANHFSDKHASEVKGKAKEFTREAIQKLMAYDWPGNVRELENVIERAVIFSKGAIIECADVVLPRAEGRAAHESFKAAKARAIEEFERRYIQDLLVTHEGNISRAAEAVQKNRRAFWELIRKYKIDVPNLKSTIKPG